MSILNLAWCSLTHKTSGAQPGLKDKIILDPYWWLQTKSAPVSLLSTAHEGAWLVRKHTKRFVRLIRSQKVPMLVSNIGCPLVLVSLQNLWCKNTRLSKTRKIWHAVVDSKPPAEYTFVYCHTQKAIHILTSKIYINYSHKYSHIVEMPFMCLESHHNEPWNRFW